MFAGEVALSARMLVCLACALFSQGCSVGGEPPPRIDGNKTEALVAKPKAQGFRKRTEQVKPGQSLQSVLACLGSPHHRRHRADGRLASHFGGSSLLMYFVPDVSTISFVVGIDEGRVTAAGFVHSTSPPALGVLSVDRYWSAEDADRSRRWSWLD